MTRKRTRIRVCGIAPVSRGFAYVIFGGGGRLADWGMTRQDRGSSEVFADRIERFLVRQKPTTVAIEDLSSTNRREKLRARVEIVLRLVHSTNARAVLVTRSEHRDVFDLHAQATKFEVATAIAECIPELRQHLPAKRKAWQTEDERMALFAAAANALVAIRDCIREYGH